MGKIGKSKSVIKIVTKINVVNTFLKWLTLLYKCLKLLAESSELKVVKSKSDQQPPPRS